MKPRMLGRRMAVQYLFMADLSGFADVLPLDAFLKFQREAESEAGVAFEGKTLEKWNEAAAFARTLTDTVLRDRAALDERIGASTANWDFKRIATTDKNVLRVAAAEIATGTTDFAVVVNEAVRLAKTFGGAESGAFVNGVLAALAPSREQGN